MRLLVRLLGKLQNLLKRLTLVFLVFHSSLNMGQPGITLVTLAVSPVTTTGRLTVLTLRTVGAVTVDGFHQTIITIITSSLLRAKLLQYFSHLKLNENKIRIRYTIYKYKNIKQSKDGI
jgi:hypothetical protein